MKKKILTVTAAILFTLSATFARDIKPVPDAIVSELQQEFKNASNVTWKTTPTFYKATFTVDSNPFEAFFSYQGELIGISRKIAINQLPLSLIKEVNEKSATSGITELFELLTDRGTEYFITYVTGKGQKTYKSMGTSWYPYEANEFFQGI
ncbi:MAG TPA: hypothetical protein VK369_01695 [Segetibacter sp.]|jgi:hypothetical protein|nr:hypothetical protein [Segetibacter sp.]